MIYTAQELARISGSRLAVTDRIYKDDKGNTYKGTKNNRLEQIFTSDKTIGVKLNVDDTTKNLNDYLKESDTKYNSLLDFDKFVQDFLNSYTYAQKEGYKVFNYTGDNITEILIYENDSLLNKLYTVTFSYTGDNLTSKTILKSDNSYSLIKEYIYDINNNIINIKIS